MAIAFPFAIILCKFNDDDSEPFPRSFFEEMFTAAGIGKFNMVDYFHDMSHGAIDISGSQVFGWHTLAQKQSDYVGSGANPQGREDLKSWARAAEPQASGFSGMLVVTNVGGDLFGSPSGAVTNDGRWEINGPWNGNGMSSLCPSILGHEMGHVLGLVHSGRVGSADDYLDPWDVMSIANTNFLAPHPYFTDRDEHGHPIFRMGPGLSAANMWLRGWLDSRRIHEFGNETVRTTVQIRPLHRPDLRGNLAIRIDGKFIEFRIPERWDAGLDEPVILIHEAMLGRSLLFPAGWWSSGLRAGEEILIGDDSQLFTDFLRIRVDSIDTSTRTATISLYQRKWQTPYVGPGQFLGPVDAGGGGLMIVGGKLIRIPPRSPLMPILQSIGQLTESESIANSEARDLIQVHELEKMGSAVESLQRSRNPLMHDSRALEKSIDPAELELEIRNVKSQGKGRA